MGDSGVALALGVREGLELGRLLEQVEDWWAERDFRRGDLTGAP